MNETRNLAPVQIGEVLAGKYQVERVLGVGGMGVVVAALHIELNESVALKFLLPQVTQDPETVARFLREARASVRIKSEHVARVTDVGRLEGGVPYMVMEYLTGRDLAALVEAEGRLSPDEAVDYVLQACEALSEAHSLGIVHRDLKPSNLFLSRRADGSPLIKVLDFGISKSAPGAGQASPSLTSTQAVMGSPIYMSPEHVRSARDVDRRTDIWSLGVVLHELISGRPPFEAETISGLLAAIVADEPRSLDEARPGLPPGLGAVVRRCLEKNRERRFGSVAELAEALAPFAPDRARVSLERITGLASSARASRPLVVQMPAAGAFYARTMSVEGGAPSPPRVGSNTAAAWGKAPASEGRPPLRVASAAAALLALGLALFGAARLLGGPRATAPAAAPDRPRAEPSSTPPAPLPSPASASPSAAALPPDSQTAPAASTAPPQASGRAAASASPQGRSSPGHPGAGKAPAAGPSGPAAPPPVTPPSGKKPSDVPDSRD